MKTYTIVTDFGKPDEFKVSGYFGLYRTILSLIKRNEEDTSDYLNDFKVYNSKGEDISETRFILEQVDTAFEELSQLRN